MAVGGPPGVRGLEGHRWPRAIRNRATPATAASSRPAAIMNNGARPASTEPRRPMRGGFGRSPDGLGTSASTTRSAGGGGGGGRPAAGGGGAARGGAKDRA